MICSALSLIVLLFALGTSHMQPPDATHIRVRVRAAPDSAYRLLTNVLEARRYRIREDATHALTSSDRYLPRSGMVRLHATVVADSAGSVIQLSGEWRRMHRVLIVSAVGDELGGDGIAYRSLPR